MLCYPISCLKLFALLSLLGATSCSSGNPVFERHLEIDNTSDAGCSNLQWTVDVEALTINVSWISAENTEWTAFGVSEYGSMKGADYMMVTFDAGANFQAQDKFSTTFEAPRLDYVQNVELIAAQFTNNHRMQVTVRRDLKTCDRHDIPIQPYKQYIVCASGDLDDKGEPRYHGRQRSSGLVNLMVDEQTLFEQSFDIANDEAAVAVPMAAGITVRGNMSTSNAPFPVDIQMSNVTLLNQQTTYLCQILEIPFDMKISAFEAVWKDGQSTTESGDNPMMHHMALFHCDDTELIARDDVPWDCIVQMPACDEVLGYAKGTGLVQTPAALHLAIESGTYVLLVHFENPMNSEQPVSTERTGLRTWMEPPAVQSRTTKAQLAMHEALHSSIFIPADKEQKEIVLQFQISSDITQKALPVKGVQVFASLMHMHQLGRRAKVELIRDGQHIMNIVDTISYDFDRQTPNWKRWKFMPGDALVVSCVYKPLPSMDVVGGFRTDNEMCMFIIACTPSILYSWTMGAMVREGEPFRNSVQDHKNGVAARLLDYSDFDVLPNPPDRTHIRPLKDHRNNLCKVAVTDKLKIDHIDFSDASIIAQFILIGAFLLTGLLSSEPVLSMLGLRKTGDLRVDRNIVVYMVQIAFSTVAFPIVIYGLVEVFPAAETVDAVEINTYTTLRGIITIQTFLYLLELFYRIRPRWSLIFHHIATSVTVLLLYIIKNLTYSHLALKYGLVLVLLALTEQPLYLVLMLRNLNFAERYRRIWSPVCHFAAGLFTLSRVVVVGLLVVLIFQTTNNEGLEWGLRNESYSEWWDLPRSIGPMFVTSLMTIMLLAILSSNISAGQALLHLAKGKSREEYQGRAASDNEGTG